MIFHYYSGINAVLKSLDINKGDGILIYSWTYYAIQVTCEHVAERTGIVATKQSATI